MQTPPSLCCSTTRRPPKARENGGLLSFEQKAEEKGLKLRPQLNLLHGNNWTMDFLLFLYFYFLFFFCFYLFPFSFFVFFFFFSSNLPFAKGFTSQY